MALTKNGNIYMYVKRFILKYDQIHYSFSFNTDNIPCIIDGVRM